jgi:hypothetical protein
MSHTLQHAIQQPEVINCCENFQPCPICSQCQCQHEKGYQCPVDYDPQYQ